MGKRLTEFFDSAYMNNSTYLQYYNRLTELAVSMFEWVNLPEEIDPRFLELMLFSRGKAVFFRDPEIGFAALEVNDSGQRNVYGIPLSRHAFSPYNGYHVDLTINDSVMIYNNALRKPSKLDVEMFSRRLYNIDRIIDVNVNAQKTPVMIVCDESQRLTMKNLYMQYDGNAPVIFGDRNLSTADVKTLNTGAPYVSDKLSELKAKYWNEALTYLGISNVSIQKKARLSTDEVSRNMGGVISSRYSRLNARKQACDEINRMFDLDVDVRYREDYSDEEADSDDEIPVDYSESAYDVTEEGDSDE